jgi:hypothetical protein
MFGFVVTRTVADMALNLTNGEVTVTYNFAAASGGISQLTATTNVVILVPTIGNTAMGPLNASGSVDWHCKSAASTYAVGTAGTLQPLCSRKLPCGVLINTICSSGCWIVETIL